MLENKNILIGISSGIAIYKVVDLISKLKKLNSNVKVIMTENACEFINPILFEVMSKSRVYVEHFVENKDGSVNHIDLASWADVFLLAPATANTIAKVNAGIGDNLLTSTVIAYNKPLIFAPTMNTNMLNNPITQRNIRDLKELGHLFINTNSGFLACNDNGDGRMAEPYEIIDYLEFYLTKKDLKGKKIIVTAGPTIEEIDPVRYISNYSSGKMGFNLAKAARNRGAEVVLIAGPNNLNNIKGIKIIDIKTNSELKNQIDKYFIDVDALIMSAAPCDFKVKNQSRNKIKKDKLKSLDIENNDDIIAYFSEKKTNQILIGFAAETQNLLENAKTKLCNKGLDYIVANDVSGEDSGFNVDNNKGYIVSEEKEIQISLMSKFEMANIILDVLKDE